VQRIEPVRLLKSASSITITLRASSVSSAYIDRVYISRAAPAGDAYDSAADLMAVWTTPFTIPANTSVSLPLSPSMPNVYSIGDVSYSIDAKQPLLIAVDFSAAPPSGVRCKKAVPPDQARAYRKSVAAEAAKADRHSYSPYPGVYLVENIKVGGVFLLDK